MCFSGLLLQVLVAQGHDVIAKIKIVLIFASFGMLLNLTVAWAQIEILDNKYSNTWFRFISARYTSPSSPSATGWYLGPPNEQGQQWGINGVRSRSGRIFQIRHDMMFAGRTGVERTYRSGIFPEWTEVELTPTPQEAESYARILEQLNGWPFPAWRGTVRHDRLGGAARYSYCFPGTRTNHPGAWDVLVVFPYRPVFPGVLYNTAIFGTGLFALYWVIRHYSRRYRRWGRRCLGRCPSCGYDTRGLSTCPECGEILRSDATVSP